MLDELAELVGRRLEPVPELPDEDRDQRDDGQAPERWSGSRTQSGTFVAMRRKVIGDRDRHDRDRGEPGDPAHLRADPGTTSRRDRQHRSRAPRRPAGGLPVMAIGHEHREEDARRPRSSIGRRPRVRRVQTKTPSDVRGGGTPAITGRTSPNSEAEDDLEGGEAKSGRDRRHSGRSGTPRFARRGPAAWLPRSGALRALVAHDATLPRESRIPRSKRCKVFIDAARGASGYGRYAARVSRVYKSGCMSAGPEATKDGDGRSKRSRAGAARKPADARIDTMWLDPQAEPSMRTRRRPMRTSRQPMPIRRAADADQTASDSDDDAGSSGIRRASDRDQATADRDHDADAHPTADAEDRPTTRPGASARRRPSSAWATDSTRDQRPPIAT